MIHVKIEDGRPINLHNNNKCNCNKKIKQIKSKYKCCDGCKNCSCIKTKESKGDE